MALPLESWLQRISPLLCTQPTTPTGIRLLDGAKDFNRHLVKNSPYAEWHQNAEGAVQKSAKC
jgi:hypothetical protein